MAKQKSINRGILITVVVLLVIMGIVIGILYGIGVLGKKTSRVPGIPPTPPSPGNNGNAKIDVGTVTISNLKNIGADCQPNSPCPKSSGINYTVSSTCPGSVDCPIVVTIDSTYADGGFDTSTQTHSGPGKYYYLFNSTNSAGIGLTRIPILVTLSGYVVYDGITGLPGASVGMKIPN